MPTIPLTKGAEAIVDACDFELLMRFNWQLNDMGYAVCNAGVGRQHVTLERMHRIIMQAPDGVEVDHIKATHWITEEQTCVSPRISRIPGTKRKGLAPDLLSKAFAGMGRTVNGVLA